MVVLRRLTRLFVTSHYQTPKPSHVGRLMGRPGVRATSKFRSRSRSRDAEASVSSNWAPGTGTMSLTAILLSFDSDQAISKDREVAPQFTLTRQRQPNRSQPDELPDTPTPVDVNLSLHP